MKLYLRTAFVIFTLFFIGCSSPKQDAFTDSDSIKYFRDFNVFSMEPSHSLNHQQKSIPFVRIHYSGNNITDVMYYSSNGILKRSFKKVDSILLRYTEYLPEPLYNFEISRIINDTIFSFLFSCNIKPESIFALSKQDSCNCWASAFSVDTRLTKKSFFFDEEDKVPLEKIDIYSFTEQNLDRNKIIGSSYEPIIELPDKYLVEFTATKFAIDFSTNLDTIEFDKSLFPSINWIPPIK